MKTRGGWDQGERIVGGYEGARGARQAGDGCTPRGASRAGAPQPHLSLKRAYPLEHLSKLYYSMNKVNIQTVALNYDLTGIIDIMSRQNKIDEYDFYNSLIIYLYINWNRNNLV